MQILIVDEHEVYRAACAALLRTEGMDVADVAPDEAVLTLARSLMPDVVILDAAAPPDELRATVRRLESLPLAPTVVLTSSAGRARIDPRLGGLRFLAKADICAAAIVRVMVDVTDDPAAQRRSE